MRPEDLHIGSAPAGEPCAQVGKEGYAWRAWHECRALIGQLRRLFGPEPPGCRLSVRQNPHDFGTYLTVHCTFNVGDERARAYAARCEDGLPDKWDAEARAELGLDAAPFAAAPRATRPAEAKPKAAGADVPPRRGKPKKGGGR